MPDVAVFLPEVGSAESAVEFWFGVPVLLEVKQVVQATEERVITRI